MHLYTGCLDSEGFHLSRPDQESVGYSVHVFEIHETESENHYVEAEATKPAGTYANNVVEKYEQCCPVMAGQLFFAHFRLSGRLCSGLRGYKRMKQKRILNLKHLIFQNPAFRILKQDVV